MTNLTRYKGQFIKGSQLKLKRPGENETVFYDDNLVKQTNRFNFNGWIPRFAAIASKHG